MLRPDWACVWHWRQWRGRREGQQTFLRQCTRTAGVICGCVGCVRAPVNRWRAWQWGSGEGVCRLPWSGKMTCLWMDGREGGLLLVLSAGVGRGTGPRLRHCRQWAEGWCRCRSPSQKRSRHPSCHCSVTLICPFFSFCSLLSCAFSAARSVESIWYLSRPSSGRTPLSM